MKPPGALPRMEHRWVAADHYWPGQGRRKTKIVIHNTVGTDSAAWLTTTSTPPVSAHVLGRRDGSRLNLVDYADIAWHVGNARAGFWNSNCLGYELESTNDVGRAGNGYTAAQYHTGAHCVATWLYSYGLDFDRDVVSHASIAVPAGRRHDPWGFDWTRFRRETGGWLAFFRTLAPAEEKRWIC